MHVNKAVQRTKISRTAILYRILKILVDLFCSWSKMADLCLLHSAWTFETNFKKPFKECWRYITNKNAGSNIWPSSVTLTLNKNGWHASSAHCFIELNIWAKLDKIFQRIWGIWSGHNRRLFNYQLWLWYWAKTPNI